MTSKLNELLKLAGLPLREEKEDASPDHVKNERELFNTCIKCCEDIVKMCEGRLAEKDLSDEHKKQYTALCNNTKKHSELMKTHLASYK
jgi:hypothetical protein